MQGLYLRLLSSPFVFTFCLHLLTSTFVPVVFTFCLHLLSPSFDFSCFKLAVPLPCSSSFCRLVFFALIRCLSVQAAVTQLHECLRWELADLPKHLKVSLLNFFRSI